MPDGTITAIQRFSIHDGPGIRTTVFFKGCSLRCFWCHNPETLRPAPELQFLPGRCITCGACVEVCPTGAGRLVDGRIQHDAALCAACGNCVDVCYAEARVLVGRRVSAADLVREILQDAAFYETSGGGVTLSGGDPVLQGEFAYAVLAGCKAAGVHTALETAGHYPWSLLERLLPVTDLVMLDLKHLDPEKHRAATGATNARVLEAARRLADTGIPLLLRTPVIPGVNDTEADLLALADFVRALRRRRGPDAPPIRYELLAFHQMAEEKYHSLGRDYRAAGLKPLDETRMAGLTALVAARLAAP